MSGDSFAVGDVVELTTMARRYRGVVVKQHADDNLTLCVLFEAPLLNSEVAPAYESQRGWYIFDAYRPRRVEPTDEEVNLAMRILLTGYLPGVDDER